MKITYQLVMFFITFFFYANYCCSCPINLNENPFFRAVQVGNIDDVITFIENGSNVNQIDENGATPLHFAVGWGHVNVVERLIKEGANVNYRSENGYTALDLASGWFGNIKIVEFLIDNGANVNGKSHNNYTPLHRASQFGYVEIVNLLINNGAKINIENISGYTPEEIAIVSPIKTNKKISDHEKTVRLLKKAERSKTVKLSFFFFFITLIIFYFLKKIGSSLFRVGKQSGTDPD